MKKLFTIFVLLALCEIQNVGFAQNRTQTNEFSWVYLYYPSSFGACPTYTIVFNDKETLQLNKKERIKYKVYSTGNIKISCFYGIKTKEKLDESAVSLNIEHGKNYYVKLDNMRLILKSVDESTGEKEFNNPKFSEIQNFDEEKLQKEAASNSQTTKNEVTSVSSNISNQNGTKDNKINAIAVENKTEKEKMFIPILRIVIPIPITVGGFAVYPSDKPISPNAKDYNISSIGFGAGAEARVYKGIRLFLDVTGYNYKQEIVPTGSIGQVMVGMGSLVSFPNGVNYKTTTVAIRLGAKYIYTKSEKYQPWIGIGYGLNIWGVDYETTNGNDIYGEARGTTWSSSILAGIDYKVKNMATFSFFFEAISPFAAYTMKNLFNQGDLNEIGSITFPTPRIGFSVSGL